MNKFKKRHKISGPWGNYKFIMIRIEPYKDDEVNNILKKLLTNTEFLSFVEKNLNNKESKIYFQKVQGHINEKLLVVYAFFEIEIFLSMLEDIVKVKLDNNNLETIKKDILNVISLENESKGDLENKLKNKYPSIFAKLKNLYQTHLRVLNKSEKTKLFCRSVRVTNLLTGKRIGGSHKVAKSPMRSKSMVRTEIA